ncbi:hypothetical protein GUJ93_ZPchr0013g34347 [Zizania palustris]|uniref:Uncharacterized protein n=1 Tax=Zizania palustris TaxID=103762 RepID=A0A8J5WXI9_ZIZPA|nr:hypothetical protein GUJ93_ZPchr0013g34347 [Zizania palustris]
MEENYNNGDKLTRTPNGGREKPPLQRARTHATRPQEEKQRNKKAQPARGRARRLATGERGEEPTTGTAAALEAEDDARDHGGGLAL